MGQVAMGDEWCDVRQPDGELVDHRGRLITVSMDASLFGTEFAQLQLHIPLNGTVQQLIARTFEVTSIYLYGVRVSYQGRYLVADLSLLEQGYQPGEQVTLCGRDRSQV